MVVIIIAATGVRFYGISGRSIWFDEAITLGMAQLPLIEHLQHAWDTMLNNQILYFLLFRPWHALGEAEATVRAFSAIFSVACVAVIYFLGRRLFGTAAGIIAALVLAFHSGSIWYAQEARSYSLAMFLVVLSSLFLVRFVQEGAQRNLVGWIAASVLSCYAHFFAGLVVVAQVISLAALGLQKLRQRKALVVALISIAILTLPIVINMILIPKDLVNWIPTVSPTRILNRAKFLAGGNSWLLLSFLVFFMVLLTGLFRHSASARRWSNALTVAWAIIPFLAVAAISLIQPILINRYVIFAVPAWALSAGAVIGNLMERGRISMIGACMMLGLMVTAEAYEINYHDFEDWRTPAAHVAAATLPGDVIIYNSSWAGLPFEYYLDRAPRKPSALQGSHLILGGTNYIQNLHLYERVWLVMSRQNIAQCKTIFTVLMRNHSFVSRRDYGVITVVLFDVMPRAYGAGAFK